MEKNWENGWKFKVRKNTQ